MDSDWPVRAFFTPVIICFKMLAYRVLFCITLGKALIPGSSAVDRRLLIVWPAVRIQPGFIFVVSNGYKTHAKKTPLGMFNGTNHKSDNCSAL